MSDKKVIPLHDPKFKGRGGVVNFMSWQRLEEALHLNGELNEVERIAGYVVEDAGIMFYIENA